MKMIILFNKKILVGFALIVAVSLLFNLAAPENVFAADDRGFLGLIPWDRNTALTSSGTPNDENVIAIGIWTAIANITTDLAVIATYLVIGYTVYGGYLYIFSAGDPNKVASGKKTLYQAFLGLAIVLLANVILNTIRIALRANFARNCATAACVSPENMVKGALGWVIGVAGFLSAIFVVYGGISYITSSGDPNKIQKAKNIILYALIGLMIVGLSQIIVSFVYDAIEKSNNDVAGNQLHESCQTISDESETIEDGYSTSMLERKV